MAAARCWNVTRTARCVALLQSTPTTHPHTSHITSWSFRWLWPWKRHTFIGYVCMMSILHYYDCSCHRAVSPYPCYSPQSRSSQRRVWFINLSKCDLKSCRSHMHLYYRDSFSISADSWRASPLIRLLACALVRDAIALRNSKRANWHSTLRVHVESQSASPRTTQTWEKGALFCLNPGQHDHQISFNVSVGLLLKG